ncbi:FHA domain-containing protein [Lachnospiraceae bacterium XBB2008]|nr:FHA domain-containing protein [Lachnospiraceae bacterium XBB2008]
MTCKKGNSLIVIENGQLNTYCLDDRLVWEVGRPSGDNMPDIRLFSSTISRRHGRFQNMDGVWFYVDRLGKNGTLYNGKHINPGIRGRAKPVILKDKDVLIFGGGDDAAVNSRTVWTMFSEKQFEEKWRIEDTKGLKHIIFTDGADPTELNEPAKGTIIEKECGMGIYMGDITYLAGRIDVDGE